MRLPTLIAGILAMCSAHAAAGSPMAERSPFLSLDCVFASPERPELRQQLSFFLFDDDITVDQFSSVEGPEILEGVSVISTLYSSDGGVTDYFFGIFVESPKSYDVEFVSSSRVRGDGSLGIVPNPMAPDIELDRMTGEARMKVGDPNAPKGQCEKTPSGFEEVARQYDALVSSSVQEFEKGQKF